MLRSSTNILLAMALREPCVLKTPVNPQQQAEFHTGQATHVGDRSIRNVSTYLVLASKRFIPDVCFVYTVLTESAFSRIAEM